MNSRKFKIGETGEDIGDNKIAKDRKLGRKKIQRKVKKEYWGKSWVVLKVEKKHENALKLA